MALAMFGNFLCDDGKSLTPYKLINEREGFISFIIGLDLTDSSMYLWVLEVLSSLKLL